MPMNLITPSDSSSIPPPAIPDRLIKIDEVKAIVGLGKTMIYSLAKNCDFPRPVKICGASR